MKVHFGARRLTLVLSICVSVVYRLPPGSPLYVGHGVSEVTYDTRRPLCAAGEHAYRRFAFACLKTSD